MREIAIEDYMPSSEARFANESSARMFIPEWAQITPKGHQGKAGSWYCEHRLFGKAYAGPFFIYTGLVCYGRGTYEHEIYYPNGVANNPVAFFCQPFRDRAEQRQACFLVLQEFDLNVIRDPSWYGDGALFVGYYSTDMKRFRVKWRPV